MIAMAMKGPGRHGVDDGDNYDRQEHGGHGGGGLCRVREQGTAKKARSFSRLPSEVPDEQLWCRSLVVPQGWSAFLLPVTAPPPAPAAIRASGRRQYMTRSRSGPFMAERQLWGQSGHA